MTSQRFIRPPWGALLLIAVAGRIAPTITTGLSLLTTRSRKYDVSSSVSVPWVMTTPSTSDCASTSFKRLASLSQTSSFMSWLPILTICSPEISARSFICGTALMRSWTLNAPDL